MDPISIAALLAQIAPKIYSWITTDDSSKNQQLAELAIKKATEIAETTTVTEAIDVFRLNAEFATKYRQELDKEFGLLELKDKDLARQRDIAYISKGLHNYRADILAFVAVLSLIGCIWVVVYFPDLNERSMNFLMFIAGTLASITKDIFSFEFGSSRGSKEKDELLFNKK